MADEQVAAGATSAVAEPVNAEANAQAEPNPAGSADPQANANDGEHEEPKRKGGFQRRIEKLERELGVWRDIALEARQQPKPEAPKPEAKPKFAVTDPTDPMPDIDTFTGTLKEFNQDLAAWSVRQATREFEAKQSKREAETSQQTLEQKWEETQATFAKAHADYEDATEDAIDIIRSNERAPGLSAISAATTDPEIGPELLYQLGKQPEELKKIAAMNPARALIAIGQFQARLAGQKPEQAIEKPVEPPVSRAPAPPTPVTRATGSPAPDIYDPKIPFKEFVKLREAQKKR